MSQQNYNPPSIYVRKDEVAYTPQEQSSSSINANPSNQATGNSYQSNKNKPSNSGPHNNNQYYNNTHREEHKENQLREEDLVKPDFRGTGTTSINNNQNQSDATQDATKQAVVAVSTLENQAQQLNSHSDNNNASKYVNSSSYTIKQENKPNQQIDQQPAQSGKKIELTRHVLVDRFGHTVQEIEIFQIIQQLAIQEPNLFNFKKLDPIPNSQNPNQKIEPSEVLLQYPPKKSQQAKYEPQNSHHNNNHDDQSEFQRNSNNDQNDQKTFDGNHSGSNNNHSNSNNHNNNYYQHSHNHNNHNNNNNHYQQNEEVIPEWATSDDKVLSGEIDLFQEFDKNEIQLRLEKSKDYENQHNGKSNSKYSKNNSYNNHGGHHNSNNSNYYNNENSRNVSNYPQKKDYSRNNNNNNNYSNSSTNNNNNASNNNQHQNNVTPIEAIEPNEISQKSTETDENNDFNDIDKKLEQLYKQELQQKKAAQDLYNILQVELQKNQSLLPEDKNQGSSDEQQQNIEWADEPNSQTLELIEKELEFPTKDQRVENQPSSSTNGQSTTVPNIIQNNQTTSTPTNAPPQILQRDPNVNPPMFVADEHRPFSAYNSYHGSSPETQIWYYIDLMGKRQGPFSSVEMDDWNQQKQYFPKDLPVCFALKGNEQSIKESFFSLEKLIEIVQNSDLAHPVLPTNVPPVISNIPPNAPLQNAFNPNFLNYPSNYDPYPPYTYPNQQVPNPTTFPYNPVYSIPPFQQIPYGFPGMNYPGNYYSNPTSGGIGASSVGAPDVSNNFGGNVKNNPNFGANQSKKSINKNNNNNNNNLNNSQNNYNNQNRQNNQNKSYQEHHSNNYNYPVNTNNNTNSSNSYNTNNAIKTFNENIFNPAEFPSLDRK